ncbi:oxidoreductase family protein [Tripterygium wilfordii]|uniref:Oxidoreductase family protein n=1 Tax=Tripterygium wilfordii TaxID=458696 RepID=A0A7J7CUH6_TRIWF|nr:probable 2-oxoglutarate-dependent dioxygenase AOP1 [Tripterygium wilfordii]KAF5737775.1 oxidoreductase family protein [Tripterygium wilfordii]
MGSKGQHKIPILDFTKKGLKPGSSSWVKSSNEVRLALEEYGCFLVEYNKLPLELHDAVFGVLKNLFDLPTQTKMKNRYEKPLNGYVGQIPRLPLHESMGIDNATSLEETKNFTNLMWPIGNQSFCKHVHEYAKLAAELDQMVTRMIFESYGVDRYYDSYIGSTTYLLRLLKNRVAKEDEPNLGFVTHTDKSFTTILHQNQVNGLEVDMKDGQKLFVDMSSPSSFLVFAGDALMAWSNDRIVSPSHRVIMNGKVDRYSMGLFSFNNGIIQVPEELVDEEHPLMYKPLDHIGLLRFFRTDEGYKTKCPIKAYCGI